MEKKIWITLTVLVILLIGTSFAYWYWNSTTNTDVSLTVEGVTVTFEGGQDITGVNLIPVSSKEKGIADNTAIEKVMSITAQGTTYMNLYMTLETLPDGLKDESFVYELYKGANLVKSGNFSGYNQGDVITLLNHSQVTSTTQSLQLYIWIDGTQTNPSSMMNQNFKFVLNAEGTSDGAGNENSPYIEPDISLDNYTLSWEPIENAVSYDIYSDGKLLVNTNDNEIDLYNYYTEPGTYSITVRTNYENNNQSIDSNNLSYTIEQLMPYKALSFYNDAAVGFTEKFSNFQSSGVEIYECDADGSCNNKILEEVILDERAININICTALGDGVDPSIAYDYAYTDCYEGPIENFSVSYEEGAVNFYYDSDLKDLVIDQDYGIFNSIIFKMYLIAPGYINSNYMFGTLVNSCLSADTEVIVYDKKRRRRKKKKIKDVTYDDLLLVWDFDNGSFAWAKPLWIKKKQTTNSYNLLKFSDGSILKTIEQHRIYNKELGKFTYPMTEDTPIGTNTFNSKGEYVTLVSKEVIYEEVDFYNVITYYHMNLFTNNILTSCRYSNLYKIEDMKYVKDDRILHTIDEFNVDEKWFYGLRMAEQNIDINTDNNSYRGDTIEEHIYELEKLDIKNNI